MRRERSLSPPREELGVKRATRGSAHASDAMAAVTRDLRITGVTKRGSSWQYHIEALDLRAHGDTLLPGTPPPLATNSGAEPEQSVTSSSRLYPELPPMVRYTVLRRYNDFRQLYVHLVDAFGAGVRDVLPAFPDGGWLSFLRGDDPKLLQHRREQLQAFLRAVDAHDVLKWCDAFAHFLRPDLREMTTLGDADADSGDQEALASFNNLSVGRVHAGGGYVSLSYLKSPEIRFSQNPQAPVPPGPDARGDAKRRRVSLASLYEPVLKLKPAGDDEVPNTGSTTVSGDSDEEAETADGERLRKPTELMALLSLEPSASS